ncbi:PadR family transcriptional regulator [Nocardia sp. NPDC058499]|uniref:PadR family transcriptional regulator n=1 Tax=Nocardia sp. NPDC058499 TaxID=3346530 RepID=UPI003651D3D4
MGRRERRPVPLNRPVAGRAEPESRAFDRHLVSARPPEAATATVARTDAKPGSIYHALKQMAKEGLLIEHEIAPSAVGGPPRVEYEINDQGTEEYYTLLREALSSHEQKFEALTAGLSFIVDLSRAEAITLLEQRIAGLEQWRSGVTEYYRPEDGPRQLGHIGEIMKLWVHSADAGAQWGQ